MREEGEMITISLNTVIVLTLIFQALILIFLLYLLNLKDFMK